MGKSEMLVKIPLTVNIRCLPSAARLDSSDVLGLIVAGRVDAKEYDKLKKQDGSNLTYQVPLR